MILSYTPWIGTTDYGMIYYKNGSLSIELEGTNLSISWKRLSITQAVGQTQPPTPFIIKNDSQVLVGNAKTPITLTYGALELISWLGLLPTDSLLALI